MPPFLNKNIFASCQMSKRSKKQSRFEAVDPAFDFDNDEGSDEPLSDDDDDDVGKADNKKVAKMSFFDKASDSFIKGWLGAPAKYVYTHAANFLSHFKSPIYYGWIPLVLFFGVRNVPAGKGESLKRALSILVPVAYLDPIPEGEAPQMYMAGGQQAPQGYDES